MRTREEMVTDAIGVIELMSIYKVLKLNQIVETIPNKKSTVKKSIIRFLQRQDQIFVYDDICLA